jgi:intein-encoded DNA endonuclease-like protein
MKRTIETKEMLKILNNYMSTNCRETDAYKSITETVQRKRNFRARKPEILSWKSAKHETFSREKL